MGVCKYVENIPAGAGACQCGTKAPSHRKCRRGIGSPAVMSRLVVWAVLAGRKRPAGRWQGQASPGPCLYGYWISGAKAGGGREVTRKAGHMTTKTYAPVDIAVLLRVYAMKKTCKNYFFKNNFQKMRFENFAFNQKPKMEGT